MTEQRRNHSWQGSTSLGSPSGSSRRAKPTLASAKGSRWDTRPSSDQHKTHHFVTSRTSDGSYEPTRQLPKRTCLHNSIRLSEGGRTITERCLLKRHSR